MTQQTVNNHQLYYSHYMKREGVNCTLFSNIQSNIKKIMKKFLQFPLNIYSIWEIDFDLSTPSAAHSNNSWRLFHCMEWLSLPLDDQIHTPPLSSSTGLETKGDSGMKSGWRTGSSADYRLHKQQCDPLAHMLKKTKMKKKTKNDGHEQCVLHVETLCAIWTPSGMYICIFLERKWKERNFLAVLSLFLERFENVHRVSISSDCLFIGHWIHMHVNVVSDIWFACCLRYFGSWFFSFFLLLWLIILIIRFQWLILSEEESILYVINV